MSRWSMMKNIRSPNMVGIGSWGPEIWPHKYLLSPIEISVNWPGSKQLWTRPIYTDFNGAINSCGHILGHHEPIHVKFGVCWFFIMLYRNMVMKMLKCKQFFWWRHTSVLYGGNGGGGGVIHILSGISPVHARNSSGRAKCKRSAQWHAPRPCMHVKFTLARLASIAIQINFLGEIFIWFCRKRKQVVSSKHEQT